MGSGISSGNREVITITSLLRALYQHHLSLKHQINLLIIRNNYNKSNPSPKHEQESIHVSKIIARKIIEINKLNAQLRRFRRNNRRKSKFLSILRIAPKDHLVSLMPSADPASLISSEISELSNIKMHFQEILSYLNSLQDSFSENSLKIEENSQKAFQLAKARNEITDLKHYKNYILTTKQFLGDKKTMKLSERKLILRSNSMKFSNKIVMLNKSREILEEYAEKARVLREKTNEKLEIVMSEHEKVVGNIRKSPEDFHKTNELQRKMDFSLRKEEMLKEKIKFWKKQKDYLDSSQSSTGEYTSGEGVLGKLVKVENNEEGKINEKNFDMDWEDYNTKYKSSMEFFNDITSGKKHV